MQRTLDELPVSASAEARALLDRLSGLLRSLGTTDAVGLMQLRSEIATAVTLPASIAAGAASRLAEDQGAHDRAQSRAALSSLADDYYRQRKLDPYLQFASADDERTYRERERENQEAYTREMAKGTVEGEVRAREILKQQLRDAGAHGADRSPEYAEMLATAERNAVTLPGHTAERPTIGADQDLEDAIALFQASGVTLAEDRQSAAGAPPNTPALERGRGEGRA